MNQKITDLKSLTSATISVADLLPIVDVSENTSPTGETKNVSIGQLTRYTTNQWSGSLATLSSSLNTNKANLLHSHSIDDVSGLRTILNTTVTQSMIGQSVASLIGGLVPRSQLPIDTTGSVRYAGDITFAGGNKTASNGDILPNTSTVADKGRYYYVTGSGWFPSGSQGEKYYEIGDIVLSDGVVGRNWLKIKTDQISTEGNVGYPEHYGAKGDGFTDDFIPIKHAIVSHSIVKFGAKTYAVRGFIGVPSHRTIIGEGKDITTIKLMNNSPYGYNWTTQVFQSSTLKDSVVWLSSIGNVVGSGSLDFDANYDGSTIDQSPESPFYQTTGQPWGMLGTTAYNPGGGGLRKNITIKDLSIDCNFDKQAKHSSYNFQGNPASASYSYIPELSWKVRPTVHGIHLYGEDINIENVKIINYGFGVASSKTGTGFLYQDDATHPVYVECFPILISGGQLGVIPSASIDNGTDPLHVGNSTLKGNYVRNTEVGTAGNFDLMNYWCNASGIGCANSQQDFTTGKSNFPTEGGVFDCLVDPGYHTLTSTEGSLWSGSYLDVDINPYLTQSAGTLFDWFTSSQGKTTGSNGDYAYHKHTKYPHIKKISGSWYPYTGNEAPLTVGMFAFGGHRIENCTARRCHAGFNGDTWAHNVLINNSHFIDVGVGFRTPLGTPTQYFTRYKNFVVKNSYVKLMEVPRTDFNDVGKYIYQESGVAPNTSTVNRQNIQIENNTFEMPVSNSIVPYSGSIHEIRVNYSQWPRYTGIWLQQEVDVSGSTELSQYRSVRIANNHFVNFTAIEKPVYAYQTEPNYNGPIVFYYQTSSNIFTSGSVDAGYDSDRGPYPKMAAKFKSEILPKYTIQGNTYSSPTYPSTSSVCPIQLYIPHYTTPAITHQYMFQQETRVGDIKAIGSVYAQNLPKVWAIWDNTLGNSSSYGNGATISTGSSGIWTCSIDYGILSSTQYGAVANIYNTGSIRIFQIYETGSKSTTKYYFDTYIHEIPGTAYSRLASNAATPPQQIQLTIFGGN